MGIVAPVVVGGGSPERRRHGIHHTASVLAIVTQVAVAGVESDTHASVAVKHIFMAFFLSLHRLSLRGREDGGTFAENELLACHFMACRDDFVAITRMGIYRQEIIVAGFHFGHVGVQAHAFSRRQIHDGHHTVGHYHAIAVGEPPAQFIIPQVAVVEMVFDNEIAVGRVGRCEAYVLIHFFHFGKPRMRRAVGLHKTVDAEVLVVVIVVGAEVAAISPVCIAVLIFCEQALVHPVPYEAALHLLAGADDVEIFLEVAAAVAHGVGILAHDIGTSGILARGVFLHAANVGVHRTHDVGDAPLHRLLELHGTGVVATFYPIVCGLEVGAVAAFVAETPYNHARMVFVALDESVLAVENRRFPRFGGGGMHTRFHLGPRRRPVAVNLDIGLVDKINAIAVAKLIPQRRLRVVARAHGVDIVLLHGADVFHHRLAIHYMSGTLVMFVQIHAMHFHGLSVHHKLAVLDFHLAESDACRSTFKHLAVLRQGEHERVKIRRLTTPFSDVFEFAAERSFRRALGVDTHNPTHFQHFFPIGIVKFYFQTGRSLFIAIVGQSDIHVEHTVAVAFVQTRTSEEIEYAPGSHTVEVHVAVYARSPDLQGRSRRSSGILRMLCR